MAPSRSREWKRRVDLRFLMMFAILALLNACSSPVIYFDRAAESLGLQRDVVKGTEFDHVLYWQNGDVNRTLHVYLDGDGTPIRDDYPAQDPTPREPLMLHLLALDPGPAVYVGRPCYHGLAQAHDCENGLWTNARYSERVVSSLAAVVQAIMIARGYEGVSFFGYSGGGTLAALIAERQPRTKSLVTIAANLDIDAWADHHEQPRLAGSLNPAVRPPLPNHVRQRHYVGRHDRIVPATLLAAALRERNTKPIIIDGYDHVCCWADRWQSILSEHKAAE